MPLSSISLVLFVASGFIFVSRWKYSENASLAEGQRLYFYSLLAAIPIASAALNLPGFVPEFIAADFVDRVDPESKARGEAIGLLGSAIASVVIAFFLPNILNLPLKRNSALLRAMLEEIQSDASVFFFFESARLKLPMLLSLGDGRFYLGYLLEYPSQSRLREAKLRIVPLWSGYRSAAGQLNFVTEYPLSEHGSVDARDLRFQKLIPAVAVSTIAPFDMELYFQRFSPGQSFGDGGADESLNGAAWRSDWWATEGQRDLRIYSGAFGLILASFLFSGGSWWAWFFPGYFGFCLLAVACFPSSSEADPSATEPAP